MGVYLIVQSTETMGSLKFFLLNPHCRTTALVVILPLRVMNSNGSLVVVKSVNA